MTFQQLVQKADRLDTRQGTLGWRVLDILDQARINADDTVYLEKSALDWNSVAVASVQMILSYDKDAKVISWFAKNGIAA